jgi:hypothetical protein
MRDKRRGARYYRVEAYIQDPGQRTSGERQRTRQEGV